MSDTSSYRPRGVQDVTPYLIVHGADRLIQFLKAAFGADERLRVDDDRGEVRHAELRVGDAAVEIGEAGGEWQSTPCSLHFYVPDVDAVYTAALAAGATSLYEPTERDYGDREAGIRDPAGNQWFIATHLRDYVPEPGSAASTASPA